MIHDLGKHAPPPRRYDVCIVGSGPAGATLAAELSGSGLSVVVLESGGRRPTRRGDGLREVRSEGIAIKDYSRERVLGGASTTWAGLSSPLDPIDFERRAWVPRSGWPFGREELQPYWESAAERYRFPAPGAFGPEGFGALKPRGDRVLAWREVEEKVFLAADPPQDFGAEWRGVYEGPDVDLLLQATVVRLEGAPPGAADRDAPRAADGSGGAAQATGGGAPPRIERAVVADASGAERAVEARVFVVAAGGIENARLLLLSRDLCARGLGNERDQVGRGFMNHPKSYFGTIRLRRPLRELPYHFGCLHHGFAGYAGLRLTEARQRELGVLNSYVRFEPLFPWSDNAGVEAFVFLVKSSGGLLGRWKSARRDEVVTLRDYSETGDDSDLQNARKSARDWLGLVGLVLVNAVPVARYAWSRLREGRAPLVTTIRLRNFMEMEPHPANRITLGDGRDPLGLPVPVVRHAPTDLDRRSLVALHEALAREVAANGLGTLHGELEGAEPWPVDTDASHHMGATRMGADPADSVVDPDLRLHSVDNVYVAGASVLPTSGCANPTFTIVALSIRLAEHLRRRLGGAARPAAAAARGAAGGAGAAASAGSAAPTRVLVVGAGARVTADVLPALVSLGGEVEVVSVRARTARTLRAAGRDWAVEPLEALSAADLAGVDLVHVAVSKAAVPGVLARLARLGASRADLLLDTPGLLFRHLRHRPVLSAFRRAWIAEDAAWMPWLDAVDQARRQGLLGPLTEVVFDRSAWRTHGLATIRRLFGGAAVVAGRRRRRPGGARVELRLRGGGRAVVLEPRDYAAGRMRLIGERGAITDAPEAADGALLLEPVVERGLCAGFRVGPVSTRLDPAESVLAGTMDAGERVTARTDDWKRVGLRRMLVAIRAGRGGHPVDDALDDTVVDWLLEKLRVYRATPLTTVRSRAGRAALGVLGRLAGA